MGRTGVLTPVAIYDEVEIDGSMCNRASLHNISIMNQTLGKPYKEQEIQVCKMNQIIPQIVEAQRPKIDMHPKFFEIPQYCPYCDEPLALRDTGGVERLYCINPNCSGQLINRLDHFCGKKGLDIKGLSYMTLEKLIDWGWVNSISYLFILKEHRNEWIKKEGFGVASVDKILSAIEEAKKCPTDKFICSLGIPLIGKVASQTLAQTFKTYSKFRDAIKENDPRLYELDGIGEVMVDAIKNFNYNEANFIYDTYITDLGYAAATSTNGTELTGMTFVITGKLTGYKNRDELKAFIESKGGKVTGSVTKNTTYLINNDTSSASAKNQTAIKLHIPIINEEELKTLFTPPNNKIEPSYLASAT